MLARSLVVAIAVTVAAACSPNPSPGAVTSSEVVTAGTSATSTTTTIAATTPSTTAVSNSTTATTLAPPATTVTASTASPVTTRRPAVAPSTTLAKKLPGTSPLSDQLRAQMTGVSWHAGCPVALDDLRLLTVAYIGFDGVDHTGQLVVHKNVASAVRDVFAQMHASGFRIERMDLIDVYGGSDDASTKANNTSAFNCRAVTGGSGWSRHSYGKAIDINPVQNPYVYADGHVVDPNAEHYTNRALDEPGMIHDGDVVTKAFAAIGWRWGGHFNPPIDYQHFDTA